MFENVKYVSGGKFISRGQWIHPDRVIDSYEVILVIKGEVYINEGGKEYALKENDVMLLEPHTRHFGYKSSSDTSFYWMHWSCGKNLFPNIKTCTLVDRYGISSLFNRLLNYSSRNVMNEIQDYTARLILGEIHINRSQSNEGKVANTIAEWIRTNSDTQIKTKDVSEHFGYNSDYISRLFKKAYNKSLKEYIDESKTEYIKDLLLNTNYTLNEVASLSGFEEYKYFLKFFKYHTKITPTEFCDLYSKIHTNNR